MATGKHSAPKRGRQTDRQKASQTGEMRASRDLSARSSYQKRADFERATRQRARVNGKLAIVLLVIVIAAGVGIFFAMQEPSGQVRQGEQVTVEIPSGSTSDQIATLLKDNGVIALESDFKNRVSELGQASNLQSGVYRFEGGEEIDTIIDIIANGKTGYSVTIPEGYTLKQISERIGSETDISADEFYKIAHTKAKDYVADFPFLANCYKGSMEGFLFPETYRVEFNATADDVIRQMLTQFQVQIASIDMSYAREKNLDEYDIATLASIIEKESRMSDDKADISAVFYNRLHEGINLGSDVTTYYAVGKELTEDLTTKDLASKNPYNTRNTSNKGLPPGAICSPGVEALTAAASPSKKDYLYFFWSNSEKKTMFYKTQAEFDAAWAKYGD